jgi:uncharacterized protein
VKEARYLVRIEHKGRYQPQDHSALLARARRLAEPFGAVVVNLRVASQALEFDCFPSSNESDDLRSAWSSIGALLVWRRLEEAVVSVDAEATVRQARDLFNEERYWEVHEALEPLWKERTGEEKRHIQALILASAAYVHHQKNELAVIPALLKESLARLANAPEDYYGWPISATRTALREGLESGHLRPFSV